MFILPFDHMHRLDLPAKSLWSYGNSCMRSGPLALVHKQNLRSNVKFTVIGYDAVVMDAQLPPPELHIPCNDNDWWLNLLISNSNNSSFLLKVVLLAAFGNLGKAQCVWLDSCPNHNLTQRLTHSGSKQALSALLQQVKSWHLYIAWYDHAGHFMRRSLSPTAIKSILAPTCTYRHW